jgi:hypothetical protein
VTLHPSDLELQRIAFEQHQPFDVRTQNHVDLCDRCASTVKYMRALCEAIRRQGLTMESEDLPLASIDRVLRALVDDHEAD